MNNKSRAVALSWVLAGLALAWPAPPARGDTNWTLVGWNDLGMHCMDGTDFSVFSILPPFNTLHAQLIHQGNLLTNTNGVSVTYEAVADPSGSINSTAADKVNFWDYVNDHFGVTLAPDVGLTGNALPGAANTPQPTTFEDLYHWFSAEGLPLSPFDDAGALNPYPLLRLVARDGAGTLLAATEAVAPVSDEMDCFACHQSGSDSAAMPEGGWLWDCNLDRDMKLNILRLHDQRQATNTLYQTALANQGYHPDGLYATVTVDGKSILCARCHRSNALPGLGEPGVPPLTTAIHGRHAGVLDPVTAQPLDAAVSREACYRCHPGKVTRCLRGAMGKAITESGTLAIQCQSCHGNMSSVGDPAREGWFEEPNCQACHTGTADDNNGQIRYDSVFDTPGHVRVPVNQTFATNPDTPAAGLSLYRFSKGHGGLQCSACHGSPHAIFPTGHPNDNLQNEQLQGHKGMLIECSTCHVTEPTSFTGGPHGMHRVGASWVDAEHGDERDHQKAAEDGGHFQCRACHGTDYRGTVLSRSQADRVINTGKYGTKHFWKGFQVGCYACHRGPTSDDRNFNSPPVARNTNGVTTANTPLTLPLTATDANGDALTLRIVSFPEHGAIGLAGNLATYLPAPNFVGSDRFTFAAWDGQTDSNLATGYIAVAEGICVLSCGTAAPANAGVNVGVPFWAQASLDNCQGAVAHDWDFDDGTPHSADANACHVYSAPGTYNWQLVTTANGLSCTNTGTITITADLADTDHDGIADAWEQANFGSLTNAGAASDYDGDGFLDLHEFLAGTQPTNDLSYLHLSSLATPSGDSVVVQWVSQSNRAYRVSRSTNLGPGIFSAIASNLAATPPVNSYTDVHAVVEWIAMYRVELEP